jgi:lipid-binding SYLF domain-containing protein
MSDAKLPLFEGTRRDALSLILAGAVACEMILTPTVVLAASRAELDREVTAALKQLYAHNVLAVDLSKKAKGILVFPRITKAGFMFGGAAGEGALRKGGKTVGYYQSSAASFGFQAGVQWFGYALFFMNDDALAYLDKSDGWEVGVGPSIVVVDKGAAAKHTSTTATHDVYAFIFGQKGLFGGLGIEGSKITRLRS